MYNRNMPIERPGIEPIVLQVQRRIQERIQEPRIDPPDESFKNK